ncbi:hypothetical protein CGMCC3_g17919 [Colletotrichum fructicola]|nr:uncharacterized protein CGMCC3_g17919 [Colletotrichum fructicola]KAE9565906.1 hypothetical protein CGMCC3_g17919 [Colletotrichum fructicola]
MGMRPYGGGMRARVGSVIGQWGREAGVGMRLLEARVWGGAVPKDINEAETNGDLSKSRSCAVAGVMNRKPLKEGFHMGCGVACVQLDDMAAL